jgi:hypothetical protein
MISRREAKVIFFSCSFILVVLTAVCMFFLTRIWERKVEIENEIFTESSRELQNPNRGFYKLYSFQITDEKQDYTRTVPALYQQDTATKLTLVQICLKAYRQGAITEEGLANIEALFDVLGALDKQLIVRFTYDIDGQNEKYEPENLDIILTHMEQLAYIFREYSEKIFSLQGLFIGNWGEMNGTRYSSDEDLRKLAGKLVRVTEESTFLAVRSPAQWRSIMHSDNASGNLLKSRLGFFNDGMLGNKSDYGTYKIEENTDEGMPFPRLEREEELKFQNELCRDVPNGGEVIHDNIYNDLDNAIKDLEVMHVTYLNRAYDQAVLKKWSKSVIKEDGCFNGMDGLTYIERRLGYRLAIVDAGLRYQSREDTLTAEVTLENMGFAPLYKKAKIQIILYDEKNDQTFVYPIDQGLHTLIGGNEKEDTLLLSVDIPFQDIPEKEYRVYFSIVDSDTGEHILLANEENEEAYGYRIGRFSWR